LPESLGDLTSLTDLDLSRNQLTSLSENLGNLTNLNHLYLQENQLSFLPESLGKLANLTYLDLINNHLTSLPKSLGYLTNLAELYLSKNQLISLPENLGNLTELTQLYLEENQLISLPAGLGNLTKLNTLNINANPLTDLSPLQNLSELTELFVLDDLQLPSRYLTKLLDWQSEWLLDEQNAEIRRVLIQQIGYEKICQDLGAVELHTWREYTLLKIESDVDIEPMVLLKMTCPSTRYIHILRVPPDTTSAEAAITWVNWGIHPDEFAIAT
jgi:hypothetical protein